MNKMKDKNLFLIAIIIMNLVLLKQALSSNCSSIPTDEIELEYILKKSADYCKKLENVVLHFVCEEKVREKINKYEIFSGYSSRELATIVDQKINTYTYDYQLIKKDNSIKEQRILLEENGEQKYEKNAKLKTNRFFTKRSITAPIGLLSRYWQDYYNYKIIKDARLKGIDCVVIQVKPKSKIPGKPNYGNIWVSKKDFSVIKMEIFQESLKRFEQLRKTARKSMLKPQFTDIHYFEFEKNGIRFPSKVYFKEEYLTKGKTKILFSETKFIYDNYKFFTVDVIIDYSNY